MKEINPKDFTQRGWEEDPMFPPGFFYPQKTKIPHLHLTSILDEGKPVMAYLSYKTASGTKVIFQNGKWNQEIVDAIAESQNKEKVNAYLSDWLEFCRQQREEQKSNPSPARQRFRQLKEA